MSPPHGLTEAELAQVAGALDGLLRGAKVEDAALLEGRDDLLLICATTEQRHKVLIAPGGARARIGTTARRYRREEFSTGPKVDLLRATLTGATVTAIRAEPGERRCALELSGDGDLCLHIELFGPRGLWCLALGDGSILELSRPVRTKVRTLVRADRYEPPPPAPPRAPARDAEPRFVAPILAAVDAHFTAQDLTADRDGERQRIERALQRGRRKLEGIAEGLRRQLAEADRAQQLRGNADLLLAYAHTIARGQTSVTVPDAGAPDGERVLELAPDKPPHVQARAWYDRARRLEDSVAISGERLAKTERELATLVALSLDDEHLERTRDALRELGLLPKPAPPKGKPKPKPKVAPGENFRRFVSAEGYPILVGRSNEQNDRLTLRVARGNDLWFHVGGGRAGSHVVVRLPKGKTASLETLLDAGTLGVHFSKARGERLCEVIYTQKKNVRKPKGLPPGKVVATGTKTLAVRLEENRLRRLLDGAAEA